jgi:hypothetical protein
MAFVAFAACFTWVTLAAAKPARVALVDPDPELERAVRVALSPWQTNVLSVRIAVPGSTMPGSADHARTLARQYLVLAVVWISKSEDGHALWMYDARDDRVVARRLTSPPPFDDATAAAVALAIKTMLRQSDVPPPAERVVDPLPEPLLDVFLAGGIRPEPTSAEANEVRLGMGLIVWPRFGLDRFALGAGVEVTGGPGVGVEGLAFTGRWTETALLAVVHGRWRLGQELDLAVEPGIGAAVAILSGNLSEPKETVRFTRVNPLAQLRLGAGYRLGRTLRFGLGVGAVRHFRTQTYLVNGNPVLDAKSLRFEALLSLEVSLF